MTDLLDRASAAPCILEAPEAQEEAQEMIKDQADLPGLTQREAATAASGAAEEAAEASLHMSTAIPSGARLLAAWELQDMLPYPGIRD